MNRVISELNVMPYWNNGIKGKGTIVAVLGSGVEVLHPEFEGQIVGTRWAWDNASDKSNVAETDGHETSVASIIAGKTLGIAPDAKLLIIKTCYHNDRVFGNSNMPLMIEQGIHYAIDWRGAHGEKVSIINMSFGNKINDSGIHAAIQRAEANGILVVASAGNVGDGNATTDEVAYPAFHDEVLSVGAYGSNFQVASYSNSNDKINLISAGYGIDSARGLNGTHVFGGTSASCPCVVGLACLLRQKFIRENGRPPTVQELKGLVLQNTTTVGIVGSTDSRLIGSGRAKLQEYVDNGKPNANDVHINDAIDGICAEGIFDSPQYWKSIFAYVESLPKTHPEYYRFEYFSLAFRKFYIHLL